MQMLVKTILYSKLISPFKTLNILRLESFKKKCSYKKNHSILTVDNGRKTTSVLESSSKVL